MRHCWKNGKKYRDGKSVKVPIIVVSFLPCFIAFLEFHPYMVLLFFFFFVTLTRILSVEYTLHSACSRVKHRAESYICLP